MSCARSELKDYKVKQKRTKIRTYTLIIFPSFSQFTGFPGYRLPFRRSRKPVADNDNVSENAHSVCE